MFIQILSHTPVRVWAILAGITVLGATQLRSRQVPLWPVLALPAALLLLGMWSMWSGFRAHPVSAALWLGALVGMAGWGRRLAARSGAIWMASTQRLHMPGSALPLVLALTIFSLRYVNGVATALNPALTNQPAWQWPLALLFGGLSGLFLGRAIGLFGLAGRPLLAVSAFTRPGTAAQ